MDADRKNDVQQADCSIARLSDGSNPSASQLSDHEPCETEIDSGVFIHQQQEGKCQLDRGPSDAFEDASRPLRHSVPSVKESCESSLDANAGYKSPILVEESRPLVDAYSIVQVRDAVEHLESDGRDSTMRFIASSQCASSARSLSDAFEPTSSSPGTESAIFDEQEEEEEREGSSRSPCSLDDTIDRDSVMSNDNSIRTAQNGRSMSESSQGSQSIDEDEKTSNIASSTFSTSLSEENAVKQKRGKKRAQDEVDDASGSWSSTWNVLFEADVDQGEESGGITLLPPRLRSIALRRPLYPTWLHEAFHIGENAVVPRPTREDLDLLREAIIGSEPSFPILRTFFSNIFGVLWCNGREIQMVETMQAVHQSLRVKVRASYDGKSRLCAAARQLLAEDRFTFRYLSGFPSFRAFLSNLALLREAASGKVFFDFSQRLADWCGHRSRNGYDYWAMARRMLIDEEGGMVLSPDDLSVEDRQAWISQLSRCDSFEEAEEVTEEIFGPLTPVYGFPTPKVDVKEFWSSCECGICVRAKKRLRVSNENEKTANTSAKEAD